MNPLLAFAENLWLNVAVLAPWLLFGFLMAGILSSIFSPGFIQRHLGGGRLAGILKAALIGVPMPLCSCGVIPVATALRRHGAGKAPVAAFIASTPETGVDSFLATASMMGWFFATFRAILAFFCGLFSGGLVAAVETGGSASASPNASAAPSDPDAPRGIRAILRHAYVTLPGDIAGSLLFGIVFAALLSTLIPDGAIATHVGTGFTSKLVMLAVAVPMYVCSVGSIPIAAAFMAKGASAGAALTFLIAGPATNVALIAAMARVLGKRETIAYVSGIIAVALGGGTLIDLLGVQMHIAPALCHGEEGLGIVPQVMGALLILVLANAWRARRAPAQAVPEKRMDELVGGVQFSVEGITCAHCAAAIRAEVMTLPGVRSVIVDMARSRVSVTGQASPADIAQAIRKAGFTVRTEGHSPDSASPRP